MSTTGLTVSWLNRAGPISSQLLSNAGVPVQFGLWAAMDVGK